MKTPDKVKKKVATKPDLKTSQAAFVKALIASKFNATRAYMAVFKCAESTARRNASRLLTNADIQAAIRRALDETLDELEITPQRVLEEIAKMAFCNMADFVTINDDGTAYVDLSAIKGKRRKMAAILEVTSETYMEKTGDKEEPFVPVKKVKLKLADKRANLELLGKYLKIFSDLTPPPDKITSEVLKKVLSGELTAREGAYQLQIEGIALPEVLRIELSKSDNTPPPDDDAKAPTIEEMEKRAEEAMQSQMQERNGTMSKDHPNYFSLPERQQEVVDLKQKLKDRDSFAPDAGA